MKFKDLKVGQRIQAEIDRPKDRGTITEIKPTGYVHIKWDLEATGQNAWGSPCRQPETFSYWILIEQGTTEERVANRIKKLWNESNYVKNNPTLVY